MGKETTEHRKARQAVEKVQKELGKLNKINIELDPQAWKMQAEVVKEKIVTASNLTHEYLQAKGYAANTSAGQDRIDGGLEIRKELVHLHTKINRQMELSQVKGNLTGKVNENNLNNEIINNDVNIRENRISNTNFNSLKDKIIGNKKDNNVKNRRSNVSENIIENEAENKNDTKKKTHVNNSGILS